MYQNRCIIVNLLFLLYLQIQEWLCLNCQTQRAISGQLGDMGKMPPTQAGPKALPLPVPAEQPFQETATPAPVKVKKKEQEEKPEAEKTISEKVKETPSGEKIPPKETIDQIREESKGEKDKTSAPQEKKSPPEDKKPPSEYKKPPSEDKTPLPEEKKPPLEEKKPTLKDKKPALEDKKLAPGTKASILEEEQKRDLLKTQVQIAEVKPEGGVPPEAVEGKKRPVMEVEDLPASAPRRLPKEDDGMTQKIKVQPQASGMAKPDQTESGKEKTVSYVSYLILQFYTCNLLTST